MLTSPAVAALRSAWPETEIVYVTKQAFAPAVAGNTNLQRVEALAPGESILSLRRRIGHVDAVLDLHGKARSHMLRALMPRIPWVRWHKRPWLDSVTVRLGWRPYRAATTIAARYHSAVEQLVGRSLAPCPLDYAVLPFEEDAAAAALREAGIDLNRLLVGMAPGAQQNTKRWPAERYGQLAARVLGAGMQVALIGGAADVAAAEIVRRAAPGAADLVGATPLSMLGGVIKRCAAFVGNDSGPMHIARALRIPTLVFFGPTDPRQFDLNGHALMYRALECSPCHFYGTARCPKGHFRCMLELDVDSAWNQLCRLADGAPRSHVTG